MFFLYKPDILVFILGKVGDKGNYLNNILYKLYMKIKYVIIIIKASKSPCLIDICEGKKSIN